MVSTCKGKFKTADHTDDQTDLPKSTEINCAQAFLDPLGATAKYIERTLDFILEGSTIVPHAELGLPYLKQRANKMIVPQAGDKSNSKLFCGTYGTTNIHKYEELPDNSRIFCSINCKVCGNSFERNETLNEHTRSVHNYGTYAELGFNCNL